MTVTHFGVTHAPYQIERRHRVELQGAKVARQEVEFVLHHTLTGVTMAKERIPGNRIFATLPLRRLQSLLNTKANR